MRVFVGSITHETNRFSPFPTVLADYHPMTVGYEDLIREAELVGCEVVRGLCARAAPSGPTLQADYEQLRDRLLAEIEAAGPLDMVLLSLHGAQVAQGCDDCEGDIVSSVRELTGAGMTLGVLLDLHASITDTLLQHASLVAVIKEYPAYRFSRNRPTIGDTQPALPAWGSESGNGLCPAAGLHALAYAATARQGTG